MCKKKNPLYEDHRIKKVKVKVYTNLEASGKIRCKTGARYRGYGRGGVINRYSLLY
jgi:hypothetical protein